MKKINPLLKITATAILLLGLSVQSHSQSTSTYSGTALEFDGTDDYVTIQNESAFDFTNAMTVEAWIKVDAFTTVWQAIVTKGDDAWRLHRNSSTNYIAFGTTGLSNVDLTGTIDVNDGQWHHVAGVFDGSTKFLYVDGALDASVGVTGSIQTNNYPVYFAENGQMTGRYFDGKIDEVRIWDTALDSISIRENMHLTLQGNESGLVSYWQFNENSGDTLHDYVNNNNGTLIDMDTLTCWKKSTIPIGDGISNT